MIYSKSWVLFKIVLYFLLRLLASAFFEPCLELAAKNNFNELSARFLIFNAIKGWFVSIHFVFKTNHPLKEYVWKWNE